jgi:hypothetical protein
MARKPSNNFGAVSVQLQHAKRAITDELADAIAEEAKDTARRDTGFYADNIRAMHGGDPGMPSKQEIRFSPRQGRKVKLKAEAVPGVRVDQSAVVAAAAHSFMIERWDDNISRATQRAAPFFERIIGEVNKKFDLGGRRG